MFSVRFPASSINIITVVLIHFQMSWGNFSNGTIVSTVKNKVFVVEGGGEAVGGE